MTRPLVSLSYFLRGLADQMNHVPSEQKRFIQQVEAAEREYTHRLPPIERAMLSLGCAYADVLHDSALVEAARQLQAEGQGGQGEAAGALYRQRLTVLAESANWLVTMAQRVATEAWAEEG